jgi:hypothetical protein
MVHDTTIDDNMCVLYYHECVYIATVVSLYKILLCVLCMYYTVSTYHNIFVYMYMP